MIIDANSTKSTSHQKQICTIHIHSSPELSIYTAFYFTQNHKTLIFVFPQSQSHMSELTGDIDLTLNLQEYLTHKSNDIIMKLIFDLIENT